MFVICFFFSTPVLADPDEDLMDAVCFSRNINLEEAKRAIEAGANINTTKHHYWGNTPLHCAAEKGALGVVKYLVSQGANIEAKNIRGKTPLYKAAEQGHLEVVRYLVSQGANIEAKDDWGWTPLCQAAVGGYLEIVKYLVSQGAKINTICRNFSGKETALDLAKEYRHWKVAQYLASQGGPSGRKVEELSCDLNQYAERGDLKGVKKAIASGANVRYKCGGSTALHKAAQNGHLKIVKYLISKRIFADIDIRDNTGDTPLHRAVASGHLNIVKYLVSKGANPCAKRSTGDTPLHYAVRQGYLNIVKYLVSNGADVCINKKEDIDGKTPLHIAAGSGHLSVVKYLISKGANVNAKEEDGDTPLHWAAGSGHLSVVKYLISKGANVNAKEEDGDTPLHWAAGSGHLSVVKYLISKGADVSIKGYSGRTPLDVAIYRKHSAIAQYLAKFRKQSPKEKYKLVWDLIYNRSEPNSLVELAPKKFFVKRSVHAFKKELFNNDIGYFHNIHSRRCIVDGGEIKLHTEASVEYLFTDKLKGVDIYTYSLSIINNSDEEVKKIRGYLIVKLINHECGTICCTRDAFLPCSGPKAKIEELGIAGNSFEICCDFKEFCIPYGLDESSCEDIYPHPLRNILKGLSAIAITEYLDNSRR